MPKASKTFEPQIRAYWAAKPKTKTAAAWKLLMRELNKINDQYGSDVLEEQLLQAEANRWQSITLKNYEQFGVSRLIAQANHQSLSSSTPPMRCSVLRTSTPSLSGKTPADLNPGGKGFLRLPSDGAGFGSKLHCEHASQGD